jgi:hypothetical protein
MSSFVGVSQRTWRAIAVILVIASCICMIQYTSTTAVAEPVNEDLQTEMEEWLQMDRSTDNDVALIEQQEGEQRGRPAMAIKRVNIAPAIHRALPPRDARGRFTKVQHHHHKLPPRDARGRFTKAHPPAHHHKKKGGLFSKIGKGLKKLGSKIKGGLKKAGGALKKLGKKFGKSLKKGLKGLNSKLKQSAKKLGKLFKKAGAGVANSKLVKAAKKGLVNFKKDLRKLNKAGNKLGKKLVGILKGKHKGKHKHHHHKKHHGKHHKKHHHHHKKPKKHDGLLDKFGRFIKRFILPRHKNGRYKRKSEMTKKERAAYKKALKLAKLADKKLKAITKKADTAGKNHRFAKRKAKKLKKAAKHAALNAAMAQKKLQKARQKAAMGGPAAKRALAAAQKFAEKLQKLAVKAQAKYKAAKLNVKMLADKIKKLAKRVKKAIQHIFRNGYDEILDKLPGDIIKLDRALFPGVIPGQVPKGWRKVLRNVEIPSTKRPGKFNRKMMTVIEKIHRKKVRIMKQVEYPDPKRPGRKLKKWVQKWRHVKKAPPATGPVSIIAKKEHRPHTLPNGKVIPVEVTYQVAVQTVRAPQKGRGTPAGFKQIEVRPPHRSGLIFDEKFKEFPALINGDIKNVKFLVAQWSKANILLNEEKGKSVASVKISEIDSGSAPFSIKQVQSAPRKLNGKLQVAILKRLPVKDPSTFFKLIPSPVDIPFSAGLLKGKPPVLVKTPPKPTPKLKNKIVYEGVDNSIAAQNARKKALEDVQEDIQDNAINGSISERHLIAGHKAHAEVDRVRENFYNHQEQLVHKRLIKKEHRFID